MFEYPGTNDNVTRDEQGFLKHLYIGVNINGVGPLVMNDTTTVAHICWCLDGASCIVNPRRAVKEEDGYKVDAVVASILAFEDLKKVPKQNAPIPTPGEGSTATQ